MEFGEAISSSSDLSYSTYDGVLGLGPRKVSTVGTPFLQRLLHSGIDDAVFSFVLSSSGKSGSLLVGAIDHDNYIGPVVWSRIISEDKWQINSDSVSIGTTPLCTTNCHIEFNTEVEIIIGPKSQIAELYQLLNAQEVPGILIRTVECSKVDQFPDLSFTVKGQTLSIVPKDYIMKTEVLKSLEFCYLMIASMENDVDNWVLGTIAHKPFYVMYDFGRSQVGLAKSV